MGVRVPPAKGRLLLAGDPAHSGEAQNCLTRALEVARGQKARNLELRAATSLARLWATQGERRKGFALLAPIHAWFTEGFDTADLKDAKALLDQLA